MFSIKTTIDAFWPPFLRAYKERIEASPLGYRLARGAFWSLVGSLISRGLGFIAGVVVARILGKAGFGQLGMIQSTVGMFGTLAGFGMGLTATKYVAEFRVQDPARAGRIIGLSSVVSWTTGGLMTLALVLSAPWLATHTLGSEDMAGLLRAGALLVLLGGVNGAQTGALAGFEAFRTIARVNLVTGLLSFPITVAATLWLGVLGAVWAQVLSIGVNCALNFIALRREARLGSVPLFYRGCFRESAVLWRFSLPSVAAGLAVGPITWAAQAILVNQPDGYAQFGVYSAIMRIRQLPEAVLGMVIAPLLPVLSNQFGLKNIVHYNKTLSLAFATSAIFILPVSLLQTGWPSLSLLPFGHAFSGYDGLVRVVMMQATIYGLTLPFASVIASTGKMWIGFAYNLAHASVFFMLAFLLIPRNGATGLGLALALAYLVTNIPLVIYIYLRDRSFIEGTPFLPLSSAVLALYSICFLVSALVAAKWQIVTGIVSCALCLSIIWISFGYVLEPVRGSEN